MFPTGSLQNRAVDPEAKWSPPPVPPDDRFHPLLSPPARPRPHHARLSLKVSVVVRHVTVSATPGFPGRQLARDCRRCGPEPRPSSAACQRDSSPRIPRPRRSARAALVYLSSFSPSGGHCLQLFRRALITLRLKPANQFRHSIRQIHLRPVAELFSCRADVGEAMPDIAIAVAM